MNAIRAIHPYRHEGHWVFDDEAVGPQQEPFVSRADGILVWMGDPAVSSVARDNPSLRRGVLTASRPCLLPSSPATALEDSLTPHQSGAIRPPPRCLAGPTRPCPGC